MPMKGNMEQEQNFCFFYIKNVYFMCVIFIHAQQTFNDNVVQVQSGASKQLEFGRLET